MEHKGNFNDRVPAASYNNNVIIDNTTNYSFWKRLYNSVNVCNYSIQSINKSDATEAKKLDLLAETKASDVHFIIGCWSRTTDPGVHLSMYFQPASHTTVGFPTRRVGSL